MLKRRRKDDLVLEDMVIGDRVIDPRSVSTHGPLEIQRAMVYLGFRRCSLCIIVNYISRRSSFSLN